MPALRRSSERLRCRDRPDRTAAASRAVVERVGPIDPDQRIEAGDAEAQSCSGIALHSSEFTINRLSGIGEHRRARSDKLAQLASEKDAMLAIHDQPPASFEGEVGIGAKPVLTIGEKLHVASELPAQIQASTSHECLRVARLKAGYGAALDRDRR